MTCRNHFPLLQLTLSSNSSIPPKTIYIYSFPSVCFFHNVYRSNKIKLRGHHFSSSPCSSRPILFRRCLCVRTLPPCSVNAGAVGYAIWHTSGNEVVVLVLDFRVYTRWCKSLQSTSVK